MFLTSDDIQPLVNLARFLVAPPLKDCKFGKSLKHLVFRDFLFPLIRIFLAEFSLALQDKAFGFSVLQEHAVMMPNNKHFL